MSEPEREPERSAGSVSRRRAIAALGTLGAAPLIGCDSDDGVSPENDASLSALVVSDTTLTPVFSSGRTSYTAGVPSTTASITVTATATRSGATITVNGAALQSGTTSSPITLQFGANALTIVVTAANGNSTRAYTITVTRAQGMGTNCVLIPTETEGPFPLPAILGLQAMVRSDIREDRTGVPLTLMLTLVDVNRGCVPITNAAVYVWQCDKDGAYSGYNTPQNGNHANETFLRGTQVTNAEGRVTFVSVYPGWYPGRITHVHFQVYLNNNRGVPATATSQIAFPQATTQLVYGSPLYAARGQNSTVASFSADNVFGDGTEFQLASTTGDATSGITATLTVGVAV